MDDQPASGARPCPICGKPMVTAFRPFCSARCKTIDLGRWLDDRYGIPAEENDDGPSDDEEK